MTDSLRSSMSSASFPAGSLIFVFLMLLGIESGATAQPASTASAPVVARTTPPASGAMAPKGGMQRPAPAKGWNELSPIQQQALKPLAANWSTLDEAQKRKWLVVSRNFGTMPPAEQAKLHSRMTEWVALSPKQRSQARLNFAETKKVPTDEKLAKWQAYQSLTPEEKNKLAASASPRPAGAATAVKPVPAQKLATTPNAKPPRGGASGTVNTMRQVDQKTLLPHPAAPQKPPAPPAQK